ncbi:single-stranded-DNA-specific exonuclease RecJ, partial [Pseudoalteromonas sp. SIMBA_148]
CLPRFGGHRGAAGVGLPLTEKDTFTRALQQAAAEQLGERALNPLILSDGELVEGQLSLETLDEIERLAPFGREFEAPLFEG